MFPLRLYIGAIDFRGITNQLPIETACAARAAFRFVESFGRSRILGKPVRRSDRTRSEIASAVRADEIEFRLDAISAKSAFESADHRFSRFNRQIFIAAFTIRF
jgi:hypothetical protein